MIILVTDGSRDRASCTDIMIPAGVLGASAKAGVKRFLNVNLRRNAAVFVFARRSSTLRASNKDAIDTPQGPEFLSCKSRTTLRVYRLRSPATRSYSLASRILALLTDSQNWGLELRREPFPLRESDHPRCGQHNVVADCSPVCNQEICCR